jgi:hypothetical protein
MQEIQSRSRYPGVTRRVGGAERWMALTLKELESPEDQFDRLLLILQEC